MSDKDSKQHSANGVGGSNNPAANPGQDKPAEDQVDPASQKPAEKTNVVGSEEKTR
jgi:hypothetical protein